MIFFAAAAADFASADLLIFAFMRFSLFRSLSLSLFFRCLRCLIIFFCRDAAFFFSREF